MAEELHLSAKIVEVHRAHIKETLQIKTAPELISYAARWGEVTAPAARDRQIASSAPNVRLVNFSTRQRVRDNNSNVSSRISMNRQSQCRTGLKPSASL
jgi:hypothetical protein